ncbi:MAG: methyl-accepting chemotaxis protein [Treponema sp.]|nr:methyl-accepting chemotaxis protein [Treponema sp.]
MFNSLKSKLIAPIVTALIAMVAIIVILVAVQTNSLIGDLTQDRVAVMSNAVTSRFSAFEEQVMLIARTAGSTHEILSGLNQWNAGIDRPTIRLSMFGYFNTLAADMGVNNFVVRDATRTIIVRSHLRDSYETAPDYSPPGIFALQGTATTSFSSTHALPMGLNATVPVMYGGQIIGALSANMFLHGEAFVDYFAETFSAQVSIYSGNRRIATTFRDSAGRRAIDTYLEDDHIVYMVQNRRQTHIAEQVMLDGNRYYGFFIPLLNADGNAIGMLYVGFPTESTHAAASALLRNMVIIGIVSLAVIAVVMLLFVIRMLKPIDLLTTTLDQTAKGDLTKRLPERGNDEIAMASRSFNTTMEELRKMIIAIKQQTGMLSSIGNDLASNMTQTASAMNEIAANIQSVKGRIINQSASVTETNSTMEQVVTNINKLNTHVEKQSVNISEASSAIEQMVANIRSVTETLIKNDKNVKTLTEASEMGRSGLQGVAEDIQEIARESEGLLEINSVMENISSQTNLLSMNAAIEAAHAGDAGKGFAVVADEIRKLAESSSEQSKIIGTVLKKIKESIDKITSSTDNVLNRFESIDTSVRTVAEQEASIRYSMEEQGTGSKQILEGVSTVNEITRQVNAGSKEMLGGAQEVIQEGSNLERLTQEITTGMNEMATGAEQVNVAVNHVNEISVKTREGIGSLLMEVSRFKVD